MNLRGFHLTALYGVTGYRYIVLPVTVCALFAKQDAYKKEAMGKESLKM